MSWIKDEIEPIYDVGFNINLDEEYNKYDRAVRDIEPFRKVIITLVTEEEEEVADNQ